jgi:ribosomal protein L37AE/L43A
MEMTDETYNLKIWGKVVKIHIAFTDGVQKDWGILKNRTETCPRCNEPYPEPEHNSEYKCKKCNAKFFFAGAMHPTPIGEIRRELIKTAADQGVYLNSQRLEDLG